MSRCKTDPSFIESSVQNEGSLDIPKPSAGEPMDTEVDVYFSPKAPQVLKDIMLGAISSTNVNVHSEVPEHIKDILDEAIKGK